MKSLKKVLFFLTCLLFILSCLNKKVIPEKEYMFPDTLLNDFQKFNNERCQLMMSMTNAKETNISYFAERFEITYLAKVFSCNDKACFTQVNAKLIKPNIVPIKSSDSNYFVIGSERDMLSLYKINDLKKLYAQYSNMPFVMNFHEIFKEAPLFYDNKTRCGLAEDYDIFILDYGTKYVLPDKYKFEWSILPDNIKHGYSLGIAMNKKKLIYIYWIVAW